MTVSHLGINAEWNRLAVNLGRLWDLKAVAVVSRVSDVYHWLAGWLVASRRRDNG